MIPFIWSSYTSRFKQAILRPEHAGPLEARAGQRLVLGKAGDARAQVSLHLCVSEKTGLIEKARFTLFGPTALVAAAEALCSLVENKSSAQALRISDDLIDRHLRSNKQQPAFPSPLKDFLGLVRVALSAGLSQCLDIAASVHTPIPAAAEGTNSTYFDELSHTEKIALIDSVLDEHVRPYIELDAGGIAIKELQGYRLIVTYEGACTSCPSALGGTLGSIAETLQTHVHPEIEVTPDMEALVDLYTDPFIL